LDQYFTGKRCSHDHLVPRDTQSGFCTACLKEKEQAKPKKFANPPGRPSNSSSFVMPGYGSLGPKDQQIVEHMKMSGSTIYEICREIRKSYFLVENFINRP
jgi:hypothetical protein